MAYIVLANGVCVARSKATWEVIVSYRKVIFSFVALAVVTLVALNEMKMRSDIHNLIRYSQWLESN